jgi:hypothetical protein
LPKINPEELNRVEDKLIKRIDVLEEKIDSRFSTLKTTIIVTGISSVIALGGLMVALAQMLKP